MSDPDRHNYPPGEEQFYSKRDQINPPFPVPRSSGRRLITVLASALAFMLIIIVILVTIMVRVATTPQIKATSQQAPVLKPTAIATVLQPTPIPATATPSPVATLPCLVNASTWPNEASWAVQGDSLYNDGTQNTTITAPCQIDTSNYAVEAKIQVTKQNCCNVSSSFGIFFSRAPGQNDGNMDTVGIGGDSSQCPGIAYIANTNNDVCSNQLAEASFSIGTSTHTYRVEVKNNTISFFIDGGLICTTTDNRLLTNQGGQVVGLYDSGNQLQVSSFDVTALS